MGIYERITELYEKAEQENAKERARQQRETELQRDASRVASALHAHGVKATDRPIRGWLIHEATLPPFPKPKPGQKAFLPVDLDVPRTIRYYLGADGKIYNDETPIEHPANATMDAVEQYLAEIVVKNHLDRELFRDDDNES